MNPWSRRYFGGEPEGPLLAAVIWCWLVALAAGVVIALVWAVANLI